MAASAANAQATSGCPSHKPLTLDQVVKFVEQNTDEGRMMYLIDSCSVDFTLDVEAIDRLASVTTPVRILQALNFVTTSNLTLEMAMAQVARLDSRAGEIEKRVLAERDAALATRDAEFKAKREAAARIPEKSQFESTSAYNSRVQKANDALAAMDAEHQKDVRKADADFAIRMQSETRPYRIRTDYLKRLSYPLNDVPVFGKYDADTSQLSARIGPDEYRFDRVPASDAETLYKNWSKVKAMQPYTDDQLHTRALSLAEPAVSATGYSYRAYAQDQQQKQSAKIAKMLADAKASLEQHDLNGASAQFAAVLAIEPANATAKDGIAAIAALRAKDAADVEGKRRKAIADLADQTAKGEWVDVRSGLMWQLKDNGSEISWADAVRHCQELRTGGFNDWRLPTMQELFFLWEPGVTRTTPAGKSHLKFNPQAPTRPTMEKGTPPVPYHIAGGIELSAVGLWTTTPDPNHPGQYVAVTFFNRATDYAPFWKPFMRAVCVRP